MDIEKGESETIPIEPYDTLDELIQRIDEHEAWIRACEKQTDKKEEKTAAELVPTALHAYLDVFEKKPSERMPSRKPWDHAIDLNNDFVPKKHKLYPCSPGEQKEIDAFIDEQLRKGYIRESKSPMTTPIFFVPKKDGKKRMCQDYRYLNSKMIKNNYPLPLIPDLIDKIGKAKVFTKMDLRWGYNNVRIKEGYKWKAAFVCHRRAFELLVMYFGLTNSPATFQTMMNALLNDLPGVIVYIDDILIFTETEEGHDTVVLEVLKRLKDNDLFLKPEKCFFKVREVEMLGMIIGPEGVKMDPSKLESIARWAVPTKVKEVQSFLGLANYYRRFIKDFSKIATPLHKLTRKDHPWSWTDDCQKAFNILKRRFTDEPILAMVDTTKRMWIESDASDFATGAILSMECDDGKWRPCAFLSKGLNDVKRNYDVHDKEMLGIMRALEAWHHYLEGATHQFEIWTDHQNLQYFMEAKKLNRRQARWALYLSHFDFLMIHKLGSSMEKADALSRRADHKEGIEHNNENVTLLKPEYFKVCVLRQGHLLIEGEEEKLLSKIRKSKDLDKAVVKAVEELKRSSTKHLRSEEWSEEQGLVLFRGKVYVPKDIKLRLEIIKLHHDLPAAGHPGQWKTLELVSRNYWWPGITAQVKSYVSACDKCQRMKSFPEKPAEKLKPNEAPTQPWKDITTDFIMGLPEAQGYDALFVTCCRHTKQAHIIPTTTTTSARGLAALFRDHVWKLHGVPETALSDRGPQFAAEFMRELNDILGIRTKLSTAYHPQTDGQTERVNQEIEQYLRMFVSHRQNDWPEWIACAEFAYNNKIHTSTQVSPFFANYGYHPRMGIEPRRAGKSEPAKEFAERMKKIHEEAQAALSKSRDDMQRYVDFTRGETLEYKVGDKVWLSTKNLNIDRPTRKLAERQIGPYEIVKIVSSNAVKLKLPTSFKIHNIINVSRIRPYHPPVAGQRSPPPPNQSKSKETPSTK